MIIAYTTWGSVRGMGPIHAADNSPEDARAAAESDLESDQAACRKQRGYSDRRVCSIDERGILHGVDGATVWPSHGRGCGAVRVDPDEVRS